MMTPALSFSNVAIAEHVRRLNELAVESHRRWAAAVTHAVPLSVLRDIILPVTKQASCVRIHDAEHLADAGFETVLLTGRVVDSESLQRLGRIAVRTHMIVVIDHFRHAELLTQCAVQSACEIQVLIEVDTGQRSTGVRPGPDASLLATAAAQLPGIRVVGVFASARNPQLENENRDGDEELTSIVAIADHALRSLRDISAECLETVISISSARKPSIREVGVSCLVMSPFVNFADEPPHAVHPPCVSVMATVISRPTLECCVIDAGTNTFGDMSDVRIHAPIGASILNSTSESSTLKVSGEASDLRIGDPVRLIVRNPERLLNRVWQS